MKTITISKADDFKGTLTAQGNIIIKEDEDFALYSVDVPEDGFYKTIMVNRILENSGDYKRNQFLVNDEVVGEIETFGRTVNQSVYPKAWFNKGRNTLRIKKVYGCIEIFNMAVMPAAPFDPTLFQGIGPLCGNKKSEKTYRLFEFLKSNYGKHIISGQHSLEAIESDELKVLKSVTGKLPAINESDYINRSSVRDVDDIGANVTRDNIEWANKHGGIVAFCWHWMAPTDSKEYLCEDGRYRYFYTRFTQFDIEYTMNHPESEQYAAILKDIDMIAEELKMLQDADVPVLWRPLHEASGGWFWWGAKGAEPCIKLWKLMFERLEYHHKLNNLIWVWNGQHKDWYPGDEYVDIIGEDIYTVPQNYTCQYGRFDTAANFSDANKIVTFSECGMIPDPDEIIRYGAYWSWFSTWGGIFVFEKKDGKNIYSETYTELEQLKKVYNHPLVLTLQDVAGKF